jgi:hypothetical protein
MKSILFISIILFSCKPNQVKEQGNEDNALPKKYVNSFAQTFMRSCDSIVLISHVTYDNAPPDAKTGKVPETAKLLVNDELNKKVVIKSVKLGEEEIDSLAFILDENVIDDPVGARCFTPHNTVLAYKGKDISYIDFCFDCYGYMRKEFPFDSTLNGYKYKNLAAFFYTRGLKH